MLRVRLALLFEQLRTLLAPVSDLSALATVAVGRWRAVRHDFRVEHVVEERRVAGRWHQDWSAEVRASVDERLANEDIHAACEASAEVVFELERVFHLDVATTPQLLKATQHGAASDADDRLPEVKRLGVEAK